MTEGRSADCLSEVKPEIDKEQREREYKNQKKHLCDKHILHPFFMMRHVFEIGQMYAALPESEG